MSMSAPGLRSSENADERHKSRSQPTLAPDLSYYRVIESGKRNASLEKLARIASALGVSPAEFFR